MGLALPLARCAQEDQILRTLVTANGARNWTKIAECIPGRSGKSCRLRCAPTRPNQRKRKGGCGRGRARACCVRALRLRRAAGYGARSGGAPRLAPARRALGGGQY